MFFGNFQKGLNKMINNYNYQSQANIQCFLTDIEYNERKMAFYELFDAFEKEKIHYGISCSFNLFIRGIVDEFHDFDLLVNSNDIPKVKMIMEQHGAKLIETGGNGYCESDVYMHFQFGRVDIDVISGFRLLTFGTSYLYSYNSEELDYMCIEGKKIPLISMEALYILYSMMEGWQARRRYKRILIEDYLLREKLVFPSILENALNNPIPGWIKQNIHSILLAK